MSRFLFLLLLFLPALAGAERVKLSEFDQAHLAGLLARLPGDQARRWVERIYAPAYGKQLTYNFAPKDTGLAIECWQKFFGESRWPSFSGCTFDVDFSVPNAQKNNDEVRILVLDPRTASALFDAIPYGRPKKIFYSFDKTEGISFDGEFENLFHYRFTCSREECAVELAAENLLAPLP